MKRLRHGWQHASLATRIVLVMVSLLLLVQAAGFWAVQRAVERQVAGEIQATLQVGERVWRRLLLQSADRLREAAVVLAADYGFRAAVASGDEATIASALENSGDRIGASMMVLLDPGLRLVAASQNKQGMAADVLREVGAMLAKDPRGDRLALVAQRPYQFVLVPVRAPVLIGWVLVGVSLEQGLLDELHQLSDVHALLYAPALAGQPLGRVSSLGERATEVLPAVLAQSPQLQLADDVLIARYVDLNAMGGDLRVALLRSTAQATAPFRQLQWGLGLITLGALLLFALGSDRASRRVTRPLQELTGVTEALERGEFDIVVPGTHSGDEVGALARGFERMRASIASQREEILRLAYWDRLTGLPNREQFRHHLAAAISGSRDVAKPLVVITLNLDRFKHVNDVLGYASGDELLKAVAARLREQVKREGDMVARMGGDEFAILLTRSDLAGALVLTERIGKAFEVPLAFKDQTVDLSASMGVACWPQDAGEADLLMSRSEIAMHAAKSKTAGVLLYTPALDSSSTQTLSLLSDLRQALQQGELRLFLQPKLAVASGEVVAAEALVRWQHPQRGLVPPLEFIPFAEQTGFVRQLTLWIFEEAARQWAGLQPAQGHLRIAINLSTRDLLDHDFPSRLAALLRAHALQPSAFCLEITESAIMDDPQRAEATLNKLAEQGFKLSIDDFGTGYSSLAYLKRLPVHELKIDKSFVMGMERDDSDAKIVRSTIDLAHNLGLSVVAEGVENQAILTQLRQLRCDEAQGYFISKPMPAAEFAAWRARWTGEGS
jgi:diguanylate cyclase (GGDEF)-like protein